VREGTRSASSAPRCPNRRLNTRNPKIAAAGIAQGDEETAAKLAERDRTIATYVEEGKVLADKQSKLEGIIKKLRKSGRELEDERRVHLNLAVSDWFSRRPADPEYSLVGSAAARLSLNTLEYSGTC
jgi:hypothetical protein